LAVSALALSFGALYPQFGTENAAQIPTSFGGLVYMMSGLCLLALIIVIEAGPVTDYLREQRYAEQPVGITAKLVGTGALVVLICLAATIIPLRLGLRRIEMMEW
ncbi:MAG: putative ABC transporter permease subunit, partial [Allosphingosinicella sp.]